MRSRCITLPTLLLGAALCGLATYVIFAGVRPYSLTLDCDDFATMGMPPNQFEAEELEALQLEVAYLQREMQRKEAEAAAIPQEVAPVVISNKVTLDRVAVLGERNRCAGPRRARRLPASRPGLARQARDSRGAN